MSTTEITLITPAEAGKRLGKSESSIRRLLQAGKLTRHYECDDNPNAFKRIMVDEKEVQNIILVDEKTEEIEKNNKEKPIGLKALNEKALFRMRMISDSSFAVAVAFVLVVLVMLCIFFTT